MPKLRERLAGLFKTASSSAITTKVDGDTHDRLGIDAGGRINWGSGSSAQDVNLYRDAADVLKTDDTFKSANLYVTGVQIDTVGADNGQLLQFDGTKFAPSTMPSGEPIGFVNRTDSAISFNNSLRRFTIQPVSESYEVWCKGVRHVKTTAETVTLPAQSGLFYIFFDENGTISYRNSFFVWEEETPIAYAYWNNTDSTAYFFADERHGVTLDWATHEYLHRTRGAVIANGFDVGAYNLTGNGSSDSHIRLDLTNGTFFDEDLEVSITHSDTPALNSWEQVLQGGMEVPIFYLSGTEWKLTASSQYPVKQGTALPQYNFLASGSWSPQDLGNNQYGITWLVATNSVNYPIIGILGQEPYANLNKVHESDWSDLDLDGFPVVEFRPLYKLVYHVSTSYTNTVHAALREIIDLRKIGSDAAGIPSTPVLDHGSMLGLSDDDHPQYLNTTRGDARYLQLSDVNVVSGAYTALTNASNQIMDSTEALAVKYIIYADNGTDSDVTEILAVNNGTTANFTEYGRVGISSSEVATYSVTVSAPNMLLRVTPSANVVTNFSIIKLLVMV